MRALDERTLHHPSRLISRREALLGFGLAGAAVAQSVSCLLAAVPERTPTPENVLGPFYPMIRSMEHDADLTTLRGHKERAQGEIIYVMGRVLDLRGEPVKEARVELWQANSHGRYAHTMDRNTAPLDPNFQGYARQTTDKEGRYRFKTIMPGSYPVDATYTRPPHIHFDLASKKSRLVTQMFFPGQALNEKDPLFQMLGKYAPQALGQILPATREIEADSKIVVWDIVLCER